MTASPKSLSALLQQSTIDDHEDILFATTAALKHSKTDTEAQHIRLVSLLKLERYDEAVKLIDESGSKLEQKAKLESAYALYRCGRLDEAKRLAKNIGGERGARHVEAQASYRSEDFANAARIYKELLSDNKAHVDEESDLRINVGAIDAQLEWTRQGHLVQRRPGREDLEAFMTAYNAACASIARGELVRAEWLLKTAKDLCASLDDSVLTESEKTAEIMPIKVQQLYVLCKLGKTQETEQLISEIAIEDIPDASTRRIAQNNILANSAHPENPYLSHRLINSAEPLPRADHLFQQQQQLIHQNSLTIDLSASKSSAVIKSTARILSESGPTLGPETNNLSVLNAAAHSQGQLAKIGLKHILPLLSKRPTDIGLALTIVQLYLLTSNSAAAITILEGLLKHLSSSKSEDILYAPGLVALQVSLYTLQNRRSQTRSVLAKAASYWRHRSKDTNDDERPTALLQAAGRALLNSPDPSHRDEAVAIFSDLHAADSSSPSVTAGYVAAHALSAPDSVAEEANSLPPVARLIAGIDVDALEAAGVASMPAPASASSKSQNNKRKSKEEETKPAKKRVRKSKLPKDYVPGKKMDEERWLPLRDRSTYRPKGRKGKKKEMEKTQGGEVKGPAEASVSKGGEIVGGGGGAGGAGGSKSKGKKKGKR